MQIFVSYCHEDTLPARALVGALTTAGLDIWLDDKLRVGSEFTGAIEQRLVQASWVVVLWSEQSCKSEWVRAEAEFARMADKIVPIRIDACKLPLPFNLRHTLDLPWSRAGQSFETLEPLLLFFRSEKVERTGGHMSAAVLHQILSAKALSTEPSSALLMRVLRHYEVSDLERLVAEDDAHANFILGVMAQEGTQTPRDQRRAYILLRRAARDGIERAYLGLSECYRSGLGVPRDVQRALSVRRACAENGVALAAARLGSHYLYGWDVDRNAKESFAWFKTSAEGHCPAGMDGLGVAYLMGHGTKADPKAALHWLEKAASYGLGEAITMLGALYADGEVVHRDRDRALKLFEAGFHAGYHSAAMHLGELLIDLDRPSAREDALVWFKRAGACGVPGSLIHAAKLIIAYPHLAASDGEPFDLAVQAADNGDSQAADLAAELARSNPAYAALAERERSFADRLTRSNASTPKAAARWRFRW